MKIIFAGTDDHWSHYQTTLPAAFKRAEIDASITHDLEAHDAGYIVFAPHQTCLLYTSDAADE